MHRSYFDKRRPLNIPLKLPREYIGTDIVSDEHRELLAEPGVQALIMTDEMPLPHPDDREGYYGERHLEYWLSGLLDCKKVLAQASSTEGPLSYLDLGGATGRVMRHAARQERIQATICDININWVAWLDKYFIYPVKIFQNRIFPYLQLEDNSFDLVSAFSVFTHLDVDEIPWLLEIRRVLKPGGIIYATIMDEGVWNLLSQEDWKWLRESFSRGVRDEEFDNICKQPFVGDRFVWEYSDAELYNINTVLHTDYIRKKWGQFFHVVSITPNAHGFQTVVVLEKK